MLQHPDSPIAPKFSGSLGGRWNHAAADYVQVGMPQFPTDRVGLIHRSAVIDAGLTDDHLRHALRRREIERVIRGVFVHAADRTPLDRHRLKAIAAAQLNSSGFPLSFQSAAVLLGLQMLRPDLSRVHSTARTGDGYRTATQHCHAAPLADDDIVNVDGCTVTRIERTAVDVAATAHDFAAALAVMDSALRSGADREVMAAMLTGRRRGAAQARRALHLADPAAENPGESWSRAQLIDAGLPKARLQHTFVDAHGNHVARTDFDWEGRLVGEFDGKVKYAKLLRPGENPSDVVVREKAREDALRRMGVMVVRWTWADLDKGLVADIVRGWLARLGLIAA